MPTNATKKAIEEAPPVITGYWDLCVQSQFTELEALKSLIISKELPGETEREIIGSVGSSSTELVFLMIDAYVTATGKVDFVLAINDRRFHFSGTVESDGKHIRDGRINPTLDKPSRAPEDDGSWSAQATGGPPDGD